MASSETRVEPAVAHEAHRSAVWRVGVSDLVVWVVGAAVLAAVLRLVRWPTHAPGSAVRIWYEMHLLDAIGATLAVAAGLRLAGQLVRLWQAEGVPRAVLAWRSIALVVLIGVLAAEGWQLRRFEGRLDDAYRSLDRRLVAVSLFLIAGGLLAAMRAVPTPPATRRVRYRWLLSLLVWAFAVTSVLFLMPIAYLILLALEAVARASSADPLPAASLGTRILQAIPAAAAAVFCGAVQTAWISRDLRQPGPVSRLGLLLRIASVLATATAAAFLVVSTIPWIHPWLSDGIWQALRPGDVLLLALALGGASAGIVARCVGRLPGPPEEKRGWATLFALVRKVVLAIGVVAVLFLALASIFNDLGENPWLVSPLLSDVADVATRVWVQLWVSDLPMLFYVPAVIWAGWQAILVCGPQAPDQPAALDLALRPEARRRFLGLWAGLWVLCLSALPALFVCGVILFQVRLMGWNWP